jgi:hypothetical protein
MRKRSNKMRKNHRQRKRHRSSTTMSSSSSSSNEIAHESKNETGREIRGYYFDAKQNRYFKRTNEHRYGADSKRQKREAQSSCRFNATRLLLHRELRPTSMARYQFEICTHSANSIRRLEWTMNGSAQRERTIQQLAVQEERILYTCSDGTVNLAAFDFARNDDRNDDDVTLFNVWQRRIGDGSSLGTLSWRGPAFVHDQWFAMSVLGGPRGASGYGAVIRGRDGVVQLRMPCHAKAGQAPASCFTCAWSPSGGALALGASRAAKVYDLTNGDGQVRDVFVGSRADVLAVAFGSGGGGDKLLSVGTRAGHLYADVDLRARGQPRRSDARQHGSDSITWLRSLSPSSSSLPFATVLAATRSGAVMQWDRRVGADKPPLRIFATPRANADSGTATPIAVDVSCDERTLMCANRDASLSLFSLAATSTGDRPTRVVPLPAVAGALSSSATPGQVLLAHRQSRDHFSLFYFNECL